MTGKYKIRVRKRKLEYNLEVQRNITILTGDSAIGKTELINAIRDYDNLGHESGVKLQCNKRCVVLEGKNWERELEDIQDSIVFIDEKSKFVATDEFTDAIRSSDNYYVIITRQKLDNLPYSINEIYTLDCKGISTDGIYNNQRRLYTSDDRYSKEPIKKIITEDRKSGFQFFNEASKIYNIHCEPADGKSKVKNFITHENKERTLLIVDGAAFGPEIRDVLKLINKYNNYILYAPESFEWILLKSNILKYKNLEHILSNTYEYADTKEYLSWERYYEALLKDIVKDNELIKTYNKRKIPNYFISTNNIKRIIDSTIIGNLIKLK